MVQGINIQAADGKYANLNFEVGASGDVSATIPKEGGELATKAYVNSEVGVPNSPLVKTALNADGAAPIYACRAWVNFNGTGTVAIRESGNVSSITDIAVGRYVVNFTTAMPDINYSISCSAGSGDGTGQYTFTSVINQWLTTGCSLSNGFVSASENNFRDFAFCNVAVFR